MADSKNTAPFLETTGAGKATGPGVDFTSRMTSPQGAAPRDLVKAFANGAQKTGHGYNEASVAPGGVSLPATLGAAKGTDSAPYKIKGAASAAAPEMPASDLPEDL